MKMQRIEITTDSGGQTIHLPAGCQVESKTMVLKRIGRSLLLLPSEMTPWQAFNDSLSEFSEDYMSERSQPTSADTRSD